MNRWIFYKVLCFVLFISSGVSAADITEIRKLYKEAPDNEDKAKELWKKLAEEENLSPLLLAYKGATRAILAKHTWMPPKKYSYAKEGIRFLHEAVKKEGENIEIRYLRFTIEYHLPSFLGLSKDQEEDKQAFLNYMTKRKSYSIQESYFKEMAGFFIQSGKCSEDEIKTIQSEID